MAEKRYRPGELRTVEVRIIPNRGDVHLEDLVVSNPEYRILRFTQSRQLEELYPWTPGSYDPEKGIITGHWDGTQTRLLSPGHYAMELRAVVDTERPHHLVTIDVEV